MDELEQKAIYIIKLGGSVISHSNKIIDYDYLREFRDTLQEQIILGKRFVIVVGGGQTCRDFMNHASENGKITDENDLHWIGTAVNTVNAEMVKAFLGKDLCEESVWKYCDKDKIATLPFNKPIVVAGGFEAGMSSDGVALIIAKALGIKEVFDLKNVIGVYDKDPNKNSDAQFFTDLSWDKYLGIIENPDRHLPGANFPVDVFAARGAKENKLIYHIIAAKDFHNLETAISDLPYKGTKIS